VDKRSDLFSLGGILYRMVTGYGPFQGNSATTVCFKVANRDPLRATALDSDLPPELDAVIARAMAKDPAQRYQRGLEFALDLHELRERGQALSKGAGASRFSRAGEAAARSGSDVPTDIPSANFVPVGFFETPIHAARKVASFIPRQVLSWWRMPVVRIGLVFSVATIILSFFAYYHARPPRSSSQTGTAVAVSASGEPAPAASEPQGIDHSAGKVSDSKMLSTAAGEPAPAASEPKGIEHSVGKVSNSKTLSNTVADSTLDIRIEHRFSAADLSLWIDDKLAYDHPLRGQTKKHWNPFRMDVRETETVWLAAGKHRLRVRVRSTPEKYEQSATILGSFANGHPTILQINFERQGNGMRLALR
jgi:serine/threonine-protein kinase